MTPPTTKELLAILLARDLRAGDRTIMVGANMPVARAAAILASATTHPDAQIMLGLGWHTLGEDRAAPPVRSFTFDPRTLNADSWMYQSRVFDDMHFPDVFFIGGMQVDRRGNINLFGVPDDRGGWAFRGPGGVGTSTTTTFAKGYYIVMSEHSTRTFVEEVSYITALGDATKRNELGLPGGGIRLVLSPLGVFDFDEAGDMRARSLHPGVDSHELHQATGFTLAVPDELPVTEAPTEEELHILRTQVDVEGVLQGR